MIQGVDFDWLNPSSSSPLARAVEQLNEGSVKELLASGRSPNASDNKGITPMHIAAKTDNALPLMKLLVLHGGYVDHSTHNGIRPLCIASYSGAVKTVSYLIEAGAHPNSRTLIKATPMHFAANGGSLRVVETLHASGGEVKVFDDYFRSPLMVAARKGFVDICKYFLENGACATDVDENGRCALHEACRANSVAILDALVENIGGHPASVVNLEFMNVPDNWTLAMEAAQYGSTAVLVRLFELGARPDEVNDKGQLALHLATNQLSHCFLECLKRTSVSAINRQAVPEAGNMVSLPCLLIDNFDVKGLDALFSLPGLDPAVKTCTINVHGMVIQSPAFLALSPENASDTATVEELLEVFAKNQVSLEVAGTKPVSDLIMQFHKHHPPEALCRCLLMMRRFLDSGIMHLNEDNLDANPTLLTLCTSGYTHGIGLYVRFSVRFTAHSLLRQLTDYLLQSGRSVEIDKELLEILNYLCLLTPSVTVPLLDQLYSPPEILSLKALARDAFRRKFPRNAVLSLSDSQIPQAIINYLDYVDLMTQRLAF